VDLDVDLDLNVFVLNPYPNIRNGRQPVNVKLAKVHVG
jgi:hypothetical protein